MQCVIHPPDLLGIPNYLIAFHKSLGLPIHSRSLFSKKKTFQLERDHCDYS